MRHNSFANKYSDVYIGGYRVGPIYDEMSEFICDVLYVFDRRSVVLYGQYKSSRYL